MILSTDTNLSLYAANPGSPYLNHCGPRISWHSTVNHKWIDRHYGLYPS